MANQAVKDLLKRFLELENRKQAGKEDQHRSTLRQRNLMKDISTARTAGEHRYADDLELLLSEVRQSERRKRVRWRFKRQSMVLVAEMAHGGAVGGGTPSEMVGCCTIVLRVLDAALPPPFPTKQPARLYIGNLAVQEQFRRSGCGTALLKAAEKLGWRWRHREIWLHVDESNIPAVNMYKKGGYTVVKRERDPVMPLRHRLLMKKALPLRQQPEPECSSPDPVLVSDANDSKVFVWNESDPS